MILSYLKDKGQTQLDSREKTTNIQHHTTKLAWVLEFSKEGFQATVIMISHEDGILVSEVSGLLCISAPSELSN